MEINPEDKEQGLSFQEECIREVLKDFEVEPMEFINDLILFMHEFSAKVGKIIGPKKFDEILDESTSVYVFDVIAEVWIKVNELENRF